MVRERLITADEVADYLCCPVSAVRRLAGRVTIPHYRLGKLVRLGHSETSGWLARCRWGDVPHEGRYPVFDRDQLPLFSRARTQ